MASEHHFYFWAVKDPKGRICTGLHQSEDGAKRELMLRYDRPYDRLMTHTKPQLWSEVWCEYEETGHEAVRLRHTLVEAEPEPGEGYIGSDGPEVSISEGHPMHGVKLVNHAITPTKGEGERDAD